MSCNESDLPPEPEPEPEPECDVDAAVDVVVERALELAAPPAVVWAELPAILGDEVELDAEPGGRLHTRDDDGERIGVVHEAVPAERLAFRWISADGDDPPSEVEITLAPSGVGTIVHIRETRLDGGHLVRSAPRALARA